MKPSAMFDPEVVAELRRQFDAADKDGSGELDASEACRLFADAAGPPSSSSQEEAQQRLAENLRQQVDTDRSGKISFDEFCFRFGRRLQMEHNRRRRAKGPESTSTAGAAGAAEEKKREKKEEEESAEAALLRVQRERETLRREREALEAEKEQLRREQQRAQQSQGQERAAPAPASPSSGALPPGTRVELHDLRGAADLNGRTGKVLRLDTASGRYVVELEGIGGQKSLKRENLRVRGSGGGGEASSGGTAQQGTSGSSRSSSNSGSSSIERVKRCLLEGMARVQLWLAEYEWWQIALAGAVLVLFLSTWFQLNSRYPGSGSGSQGSARPPSPQPPRSSSSSSEGRREWGSDPDDHYGSGRNYRDDGRRMEGGDPSYEDANYRRSYGSDRGGYEGGYDDGYGGGSGGGGGGGILGFLAGGSSLQWYALVGGLIFLCYKGVIPVHRMSWFQLMMLWQFVEPLLMGGGGRRGFGGFGRRRRGFF